MTLKSWLDNGWLQAHRTSPEEIAELLAVVRRDLDDASLDRLSPDWGTASASQATEVYLLAGTLNERVIEWLRHHHPELLKA